VINNRFRSAPAERSLAWSPLVCALPAICLAIVIVAPFLNSAFTIDDVTFLLQARHVLIDPLHPTAFEMVADQERIRLSQQLVTGPVMAYLLLPVVMLGGSEWIAHFIQLLLIAAGAVGTAALALRLGLERVHAGVASLLVVASPAVLGMATTAMPDIAAMAFGVIGVERMLAATARRGNWATVLSGVCLAIAALCRPHAVLLCPVAMMLVVTNQNDDDSTERLSAVVRASVSIVLAAAICLAVVVATRDPVSGVSTTAATLERMNRRKFYQNVAGLPLNWVVAFPLGLLWPVLRGKSFSNSLRSAVVFSIAMIVVAKSSYAELEWWLVIPAMAFTGLGLDVFADITIDAIRRRDWVQIVLAVWMVTALPAVFYQHLPPKDLVPSAPAMGILIARRFKDFGEGRPRRVLAVSIGACLLLSILIIRADSQLAEAGRTAGGVATSLVRKGNTVWLDGAWGFQWYGMQGGAVPLATTAPFPKQGDLIVVGPTGYLAASFADKSLLFRKVYSDPGGRVQGKGAGFFSNGGGPLPWMWSDDEYSRLEVWRVNSDRRIK
jgi:hypothetical protein